MPSRYCARPSFAMERLRKQGAALVLWEDCDAQVGEGVQIEPDWDLAAQPVPDYEVDQRING